jgi:hypothetical protein
MVQGGDMVFDNYLIPFAMKLKECGVLGVASAECLNYAMQNPEKSGRKREKRLSANSK